MTNATRSRIRDNRELLRRLPLFSSLPEPDVDRLCRLAHRLRVDAGAVVMEEGSTGDGLYIITEGELEVTTREGGAEVVLAVRTAGEFLGEMSLLEQAPRSATVRAVSDSELLVVDPAAFRELLASSPEAAAAILRTMAERLRSTESSLVEQDRLAALGTLAAGLAHELNNPAAAIRRAATHLTDALERWHRWSTRLGRLTLSPAQADALRGLEDALSAPGPANPDALACSLEEDRLSGWLAERGIGDGWELAPPLVAHGWTLERVAPLAERFETEPLAVILGWLSAGLAARGLRDEIETSAAQISTIVGAVRSYSFMDRAPVQEVDVRETLEATLVMLRHRLKEGITVEREYDADVPRIEAHGAQLTQVWTNLITNALDAMGSEGRLLLRLRAATDRVVVEVIDDGPGIPDDVRSRIFDPFFTTKGPGAGTGLGLHIVRNIVVHRHGGRVDVESEPGRTRLAVSLPLRLRASPAESGGVR